MTTEKNHASVHRNHVRNGFLALALGSLSLTAQAVEWNKATNFLWKTNGNISQGVPGAGSGSIISEVSAKAGGGVHLNGSRALPWHPQPDQYADWAKWKASISPQQIAKGVVRPGFIIPLIAGELISKLLNEACVRLAGGEMKLSDGAAWEECAPAGETTNYVPATQVYTGDKGLITPSASAACTSMAPLAGVTLASVVIKGTGYAQSADCMFQPQDGGPLQKFTTLQGNPACRMLTGQWSISLPEYRDGTWKCLVVESNEAYQPATPEAVQARIKDKVMNWTQADFSYGYTDKQGDGTGLVLEILDKGGKFESDPPEVNGPGTSTAPPHTTTKTNTDGSTTTTTTTTTNHYTYSGDKVSYTTTAVTVSQTCTAAGSCTTETETKTDDKPKDPDKEKEDECEKFPERVGCAELDEVSEEVPSDERNLTFSEESLFGGGSCPSDKYMTMAGQNMKVYDWQQSCSYIVTYLRPIILVLAAFVALMIVLPARSEA